MSERGAIYHEQAYALGKMLNHSGWRLPRSITPSDIDAVFDNDGRRIECELSSQTCDWDELSLGQRRLYEGIVKGGRHVAALCRHEVPPDSRVPIDTVRDIVEFTVMFWSSGKIQRLRFPGSKWVEFVMAWFEKSPDSVLETLRSCRTLSPAQPSSLAGNDDGSSFDFWHRCWREVKESELSGLHGLWDEARTAIVFIEWVKQQTGVAISRHNFPAAVRESIRLVLCVPSNEEIDNNQEA